MKYDQLNSDEKKVVKRILAWVISIPQADLKPKKYQETFWIPPWSNDARHGYIAAYLETRKDLAEFGGNLMNNLFFGFKTINISITR